MVTDQDFAALKQQVALLSQLLHLKVLGNDPSTNYGLQGASSAATSFSLATNGVQTTLTNTIDSLGYVESVGSLDTLVANGDNAFVSPKVIGIMAWDASIPGYKLVAALSDAGSGTGEVILQQVGSAKEVVLNAGSPSVLVTDGTLTSAMTPSDITVAGLLGVGGALVLNVTVAPATVGLPVVTAVSLTTNNFTGGIRTT